MSADKYVETVETLETRYYGRGSFLFCGIYLLSQVPQVAQAETMIFTEFQKNRTPIKVDMQVRKMGLSQLRHLRRKHFSQAHLRVK
jgi:hypothetical protein